MNANTVEDAAQSAEAHPAMRMLARSGFAASGVVHLLLGGLVIAVTIGGSGGETSQSGAFEAIAAAPFGAVVVWGLAVLLAALGVYDVVDGVVVHESGALRRWSRRVGMWGRGIVFLALAGVAVSVVLGARGTSDESAREASRGILALASRSPSSARS